MLFSSPIFLFGFLPIFFACYFLAPLRARNGVIFAFSLFFYFVDAGVFTLILLMSVAFNFMIALYIYPLEQRYRKIGLSFGIALNLLPLMYYKYWSFFLKTVTDVVNASPNSVHTAIPDIVLLSGVSFFTFHAISYLIDAYLHKVQPSRSFINFGMYMTNFPQLIAGPIVRYSEISEVVEKRPTNVKQIENGILIFSFGLAKKVIFADTAGNIADPIFAMNPHSLTLIDAWIGALCYSLQIYFDFAGYSSMAIGLGLIMGFNFPINFNQPYRAQNITEFWHRWHMTLSRWFRDYVYIPLGGNRKGASKTLFNLFIVFFLCGLWHGAAYTFIAWGIYHGVFLVCERLASNKFHFQPKGFIAHVAALVVIVVGWVIFRSADIVSAGAFIEAMFGFSGQLPNLKIAPEIAVLLTPDKIAFLLLAVLFCFFPMEIFEKKNWPAKVNKFIYQGRCIGAFFSLFFSFALIASNGFNPFIYFKF